MGDLEQPCTLASGYCLLQRLLEQCPSGHQMEGTPGKLPRGVGGVEETPASGMRVLSPSPALRQGNYLQELLTRCGGM